MKTALMFPAISFVLLPLAVAAAAEPAGGGPAAAIMSEIAETETGGDTVTWVVSPGVRNEVTIKTAEGYRTVTSNGWPDHEPGQFPRRGNPNTPTGQQYKFRVVLAPKAAEQPVFRGGWWWGVALNGVPFEPGTGETWNNDPRSGWRYEAATGFLNLGLDEHNAHVQPNGSYHYHALPKGLVEKLGGDEKRMLLVGWAADGFPLYTSRAYSEPKNAGSALRSMKSSYRLRDGRRPEEPEGPGGVFDGRFSQDFEFVKDSGDLDECNGRTGVTPEFPEGTYYYCITAEFPFVPRKWRGEPDASFGKGGPPPGGGGRGGMRPGGAPRGILEEPGGPPQGGTGGPGGRPPGVPPVMEALDLNKDGRLDRDELGKAAESLKKLDANGDGTIGPEEYRPAGGRGWRGWWGWWASLRRRGARRDPGLARQLIWVKAIGPMSAESFSSVTVQTKANVYFDGRVVSHTVLFPTGEKKTLGLIYPGEYHFGTAAAERMEIIAGSCSVVLDGGTEAATYPAGTHFDVAANSGFTITVAEGICEYICSFLA